MEIIFGFGFGVLFLIGIGFKLLSGQREILRELFLLQMEMASQREQLEELHREVEELSWKLEEWELKFEEWSGEDY